MQTQSTQDLSYNAKQFFERKIRQIDKIVGLTSLFLGIGVVGSILYLGIKAADYRKEVLPIIKKVEIIYDKDSNGAFSLDEGVRLAKDVGYERILPSESILFQLEPNSRFDRTIKLKMCSSHYSAPEWKEEFIFPVSKLEELTK